MTRVLGLMLAALLGCAGCGDAGDQRTVETARRQAPAPARGSDATRARHTLLRLDDLPPGWQSEPGTIVRIRCADVAPYEGASVLLTTLRMTHEHDGVQERVAIFPSVAAARLGLKRLDSRAAARCLRRTLQRHVSEETEAPATPATLVRLDRPGPDAEARRYVSESVSNYGRATAYIDAVHMRVGRVVAALTAVTGPKPPDEELYDHLVELALRRVRAAGG